MTEHAEVGITGAAVRAALADEATASLPDGALKDLVLTLVEATDRYGSVELAARPSPRLPAETWEACNPPRPGTV